MDAIMINSSTAIAVLSAHSFVTKFYMTVAYRLGVIMNFLRVEDKCELRSLHRLFSYNN
jgi:hypothetical protein